MLYRRFKIVAYPAVAVGFLLAVSGCWHRSETLTPKPAAPDSTESAVTFYSHIQPIIVEKCAGCHSDGQGAPFAFVSYDDVRNRVEQIAEVTQSRFMPPWLPRPGANDFENDRSLSEDQIGLFQKWVKQGAPKGDDSNRTMSSPLSQPQPGVWSLGTPDLVLESPEFDLPASGADLFRNFIIPTGLTSTRYVASIELRPTNPLVTHHARIGLDNTHESERRDAHDPGPGYAGMAWGSDPDGQMVAWVPGMRPSATMNGASWPLTPNDSVVLHTHLQPSGKAEKVAFQIGLRFAEEAPTRFPVMLRVGSRNIDIPPGASAHVVEDSFELPVDIELHSVFPHAHSLCRSVSAAASTPGTTLKPLIEIERFDENWHDVYRYRVPIRLRKGTRIITKFVYDNSEENPRNRHRPPVRVTYGSNADDEMADIYMQVSVVDPEQRAVLTEAFEDYERGSRIVGYSKNLELHPTDPWSREALAAALVQQNQIDQALSVLANIPPTESKSVYYSTQYGLTLLAAKRTEEAETWLKQAIETDAEFAPTWMALGRLELQQGHAADAVSAFEKASALAPGLTEARLGLVDAQLQIGKLTEAASICEELIRDEPSNPIPYQRLADIRAHESRFGDALDLWAQARQIAPYIHPPRVLLAAYFLRNGNLEEARRELQTAKVEFSQHPVPELFLGQFALQEKKTDEANQHLKRALSLAMPASWPKSHQRRFQILLHSARFELARQTKDLDLARRAVAAWVQLDPENPQVKELARKLEGNKL